MKICIIGQPRSRSSILRETLSKFYQIEIIGNELDFLSNREGEQYQEFLKTILNKISTVDSGVIRFHPLQLRSRNPFKIVNLDNLRFSDYNKIFITTRKSAADNIASNFIAVKLRTFTYKNSYELESRKRLIENFKNIYFTEKDYFHIKNFIVDNFILDHITNYLRIHNIPYIELEYNDIPEYIKQNYPDVKTSMLETNFDYKSIIDNFDEIEGLYNKAVSENWFKVY